MQTTLPCTSDPSSTQPPATEAAGAMPPLGVESSRVARAANGIAPRGSSRRQKLHSVRHHHEPIRALSKPHRACVCACLCVVCMATAASELTSILHLTQCRLRAGRHRQQTLPSTLPPTSVCPPPPCALALTIAAAVLVLPARLLCITRPRVI